MIRVGTGKLKMRFVESHNDMGHFFPSEYVVNDWFWMGLDDYIEKSEFSNFDMTMPKAEMDLILEELGADIAPTKFDPNPRSHPRAYRMKQLLQKSKQLVWEFNVPNNKLDGYLRCVVVLGEPGLCTWSGFDCFVKLPILRKFCILANWTNRWRVIREWKEWHDFLETVPRHTGGLK